jgi:hypothetical protein
MPEYTNDFGLLKWGPGDTLATDNYKGGTTDRELIAALLRLGAETHHHNGAASATSGTDVGARNLDLTLGTDSGGIPAGVRAHYAFTLTASGVESELSDVLYVDTDSPIPAPASPTLGTTTTGGTLAPGTYYYILTAWEGVNTSETNGKNAATITIPVGTATNKITITFPTLPAGATGFNIYRKKAGGVRYVYLASITGSGPTYDDTGSVTEDSNRTYPSTNLTNRQNHVVVALEGTALDPGVTWSLYRTYAEGDWLDSKIASGLTGTSFDDTGAAGSGSPPLTGIAVASPSKILLTGGAEVQGVLPSTMIAGGFAGSFATGAYPTAAAANNGSILWDTTLARWFTSNGSAWTILTPQTNQVLVGWFQDNVPGTQSAVALSRAAARTEALMPLAGSVVGIIVYTNEARTAGTLTVEATINGTGTGLTAVLDGTNTTTKLTTQAIGADTFTAGQRLGVKITTASWTPTTADIDVSLLVTLAG